MTTAIVCGSHKRGDKDFVFAKLDACRRDYKITRIVCGGADFVDLFAIQWAMARRVNFAVMYAEWSRHGSLAGPLRNQRMLDTYKPVCIIAFDGDNGTIDMKQRARAHQLPVYEQT